MKFSFIVYHTPNYFDFITRNTAKNDFVIKGLIHYEQNNGNIVLEKKTYRLPSF